jgi:hypothetical protein
LIVQEVFGYVKRNLSGARRRKDTTSEEGARGKGRLPFSMPQYTVTRSATALRFETVALSWGI